MSKASHSFSMLNILSYHTCFLVRVKMTYFCYIWFIVLKYCKYTIACILTASGTVWSQYENLGQLCNDPRARAVVLADMDSLGREAQAIHLYETSIWMSSLISSSLLLLKYVTDGSFFCSWEALNLWKLWLWCLSHSRWKTDCSLQHLRQVFSLKNEHLEKLIQLHENVKAAGSDFSFLFLFTLR